MGLYLISVSIASFQPNALTLRSFDNFKMLQLSRD